MSKLDFLHEIKKGFPPGFYLRPWSRHSLVLLVAGLAYVAIGTTFIATPNSPGRSSALVLALRVLPIEFWGTVWIVCGVLAIISSRWPAFAETWGYTVLTGLSAGWSATYLAGIIFLHAPYSGLGGMTTWGLIAFMWWAISGLVNPSKVIVVMTNADSS